MQLNEKKWFTTFQDDIIHILINTYNFSENDAQEAILNYEPVFSLIDHKTEPFHVALRISNDIQKGLSPKYYIEYWQFIKETFESLAESKKIPSNKKKLQEFCMKCNYPKYKNEPCLFCK